MRFERSKLGWPRRRSIVGSHDDQESSLGWPEPSDYVVPSAGQSDSADVRMSTPIADAHTDNVSRETMPDGQVAAHGGGIESSSPSEADVSRETSPAASEIDRSAADAAAADAVDAASGTAAIPYSARRAAAEHEVADSERSTPAITPEGGSANQVARPEEVDFDSTRTGDGAEDVSVADRAEPEIETGKVGHAQTLTEPGVSTSLNESVTSAVSVAPDDAAASTLAEEASASTDSATDSETGSAAESTADPDPVAEQVSRETSAPREELPRPARTRVLTVSNQKGGVGKTTTAVNLAVALASRGARVLVVDLDPQGNASTGLDIDHPNGTPSTYNVIVDRASIAETAQPVVADGVPEGALLCVPATSDLAGAEVELAAVVVGREFRLKQAIDAFLAERTGDDRLDYVFIDCPPSLGLLTVNALAAANEVLIPVQCEYYALEGLGQLLETIELIHGYLNPQLHVSTMLLTMFDARTKLAGQVVDEVRSHFGDTVMRSIIPRSVKVSEAPSYRQSVMTYDPMSRGAISYLAAAREFAARGADTATPAP